jgi:hypothetical protein
MNGTLISHPPGGGGSGSSVTNGGPACEKSVPNNNQIARAPQLTLIDFAKAVAQ